MQYNRDPLVYTEQIQNQPLQDYTNYQQPSVATVPNTDIINQTQEVIPADSHVQTHQYQQEQQPYAPTNNEIPEVDSYNSYYQPLKPAEIPQEELTQQPLQHQPYNSQEPFQPEQNQTTFTGAYDYYQPNVSSQQYQEVSFH